MKFSKSVFSIAMTLVALSASKGFAEGVRDGGGGNAVVCRNADGSIRSAELLDLYEGRVLFNYTIPKDDTSPVDAFKRMNDKMITLWYSSITEEEKKKVEQQALDDLLRFQAKMHFLTGDETLGDYNDSYPVVVPRSCKVERLAFYDDRFELLEVVKEIYDRLKSTDQAALILHESIYQQMRELTHGRENNSGRTRTIIAYLFSSNAIESLSDGIPFGKDTVIRCVLQKGQWPDANRKAELYLYRSTAPSGEKGTMIQFLQANDVMSFSKKTVFLKQDLLDPKLMEGGSETLRTVSKIPGSDYVSVSWRRTEKGELKIALRYADAFEPYDFNTAESLYCNEQSKPKD